MLFQSYACPGPPLEIKRFEVKTMSSPTDIIESLNGMRLKDPKVEYEIKFELTTPGVHFGHAVLICCCAPQIQVAIRSVVTIRLTIGSAAEPPRRTIRGPPRSLRCNSRVHDMTCASSATVLRACYINDPVRIAQWYG